MTSPMVRRAATRLPVGPLGRRITARIRQEWANLDADPIGRRIPGTGVVIWLSLAIGLTAAIITTSNGSNLWYSDAQSHLTIARRIIESKSPGPGQLGTVWLPFPHVLLLPFVQVDVLWHTGWAACILGIGCLAATTASLYRIASLVGLRRAGRIVVVLALLANPSLLYTFTTGLTEPSLMAGMLLAISGLARWGLQKRPPTGGELAVFAGFPAAFAVLSRYEGWALLAAGSVFVVIVGLRRKRGWAWSLKMAACFATAPAIGITAWLAYNWAVYANPLEFMNGQYSAFAQQKNLLDNGMLTSRHNIGVTLWTYNWALIETAGAVLIVCAALGLLAALWRWGPLGRRTLVVGLLAVSYAFSLLSLYLGQTAVNNDHSFPENWWNNRFALSVCPLLALLTGVLVDVVAHRARILGAAVVLSAIMVQNVWWAQDLTGRSAILAEAAQSHRDTLDSTAVGRYLAEHYQGGGILMDESARGNAILPSIGIPLANYDIRASGDSFDEALRNPAAHDEWILATIPTPDAPIDTGPVDLVAKALRENPSLAARYRIVFSSGDHALYQRIDNGG
ncbi:hypothetical protein GIS00_18100 [Nakamurella sp. YIM 132087]|uniref:Glycosyltransferase RgtA/B/C/D-like domain-containing protein n=1 Tax=Nakamurella alba TaxID=2665158 RepID=A0A7K1FNW4_9ACTN|nr:hypothetical protein [Nakamurella alba]MTD15851.1 hypothetical protein [Nakamurella alba]